MRASLAESSATSIISVRGITVAYGAEPILQDVSFEVATSEIVSVLGRSGCGKTTLFKVMTGLLEPLKGEVIIDGDRVLPLTLGGSVNVLRKIGVLFQSGALFTSMTLAENVAVPLRLHTKLSERTIVRLVTMKLDQVGLAGYAGYLPSEVSGGMRKRAALARAIALDPKILFFDEPSAGLDPVTAAQLDSTILKINRSLGTTMVVVTHEPASIFAISHRAIMLDPDEKTIIADGPPLDLARTSQDPRVLDFFGRRPPTK
ncbi:MAG: ATP-binding cassette domain-containing protein [Pseudomonadota bacterium]